MLPITKSESTKSPAALIKGNLGFLFNFANLSFIQVSNVLIQFFLFSLITRKIGLHALGTVMVVNASATLAGIFINYGTNQSGIKDVALFKTNAVHLSGIFYPVYFVRLILFSLSLLVIWGLYLFAVPDFLFYFFALPILLSEALNPLFFFIGIEKLFLYNVINLASRVISAVLILVFIKSATDAYLVNFFLGLGSAVLYFVLVIYAIRKYKIFYFRIGKAVWTFFKQNFYLVCNNLSVQLQQSVFLFAISAAGNGLVLGAYAICDKIVWIARLFIISFSSAIFPKATLMQKEDESKWKAFKKQVNWILAGAFIVAGIVLFFGSPLIVKIFTGKPDTLTEHYIRAISFVPLITALNSLNVLELLMKNKYHYIFIIALILLAIASIISFALIKLHNPLLFGYYLLLMESVGLLLYVVFIRQVEKTPELSAS